MSIEFANIPPPPPKERKPREAKEKPPSNFVMPSKPVIQDIEVRAPTVVVPIIASITPIRINGKLYRFRDLLIGARRRISLGQEEYLCLAIRYFILSELCGGEEPTDEQFFLYHDSASELAAPFSAHLLEEIHPFSTYTNWYEHTFGELNNFKLARIRWIDTLIVKHEKD